MRRRRLARAARRSRDYGEVKAFYDYDRNGRIEGVPPRSGPAQPGEGCSPEDGTGE